MLYSATSLEPSHRNYHTRAAKQRGFPYFQRPHIVACFSVDSNRKCTPNDRQQLFFVRRCPPHGQKVHLDLSAGYEIYQKKPETDRKGEQLKHILQMIVADLPKYLNEVDLGTRVLRANVVAWRGLLRLLMTTPYETREGWSVLATRFKGTIYLVAWQSDKQYEADRSRRTSEMQRIFSYGYKFEQYRQTRIWKQEPDTSMPVKEAEEFGCMFEGNLAGVRLLYGAEMDGAQEEDADVDLDTVDLNTLRFRELKVNLRPQTSNQERNFYKFKARNWWAQCFLAGVEQVQVGVRTEAGVVDEIYTTSVDELADQSKVVLINILLILIIKIHSSN